MSAGAATGSTRGTGNALENINSILLQSSHCSLQCGTWDPWLVQHRRRWCLCTQKTPLSSGIPFPGAWIMLQSVVFGLRYKALPTGSRRPHHKAGAAAFQYSPPAPSAPRAGCPCLVPGDPRGTDRHTGHTALADTLFTLCPHRRTQPKSLIFSTLRPGLAPRPSGLTPVLSKRTQHS